MNVSGMIGCCTASIIYGFGSSGYASHGPLGGYPEERIRQDLKDKEAFEARMGKAVCIIILNSDQVTEDKILRDSGYIHSRWMKKKQHPDTKLRVYYKPLDVYLQV